MAKQHTWVQWWWEYCRRNRGASISLGVGALALVLLLLQGLVLYDKETTPRALQLALLGGLGGFAATTLGSLPAWFFRQLDQRLEDILLGFAAGMMLAASAFSLLLPGIDAAAALIGNQLLGTLTVAGGMFLGVFAMLGLEAFTPHIHHHSGAWGPATERWQRVWLFILAIALHNLPEGMAIGVGFSQADMSVGLPVAAAIALQDIPEGFAVAVAMRSAGFSPFTAVASGAASGLLEPIGALLGVGLSSGLAIAYPLGLGFAAGAMLFVVSHEVIPETHRHGHQTVATFGLICGFALMMVMDTALG